MERRLSKRIIVGFKAEFVLGGISYTGVIENLSENGICVITAPAKTAVDFTPGATPELKFQTSSGKTLDIYYKVIWSNKTPSHGLTNRIGMKIITPSWDKSNIFLSKFYFTRRFLSFK
jgi:hypothetical protein